MSSLQITTVAPPVFIALQLVCVITVICSVVFIAKVCQEFKLRHGVRWYMDKQSRAAALAVVCWIFGTVAAGCFALFLTNVMFDFDCKDADGINCPVCRISGVLSNLCYIVVLCLDYTVFLLFLQDTLEKCGLQYSKNCLRITHALLLLLFISWIAFSVYSNSYVYQTSRDSRFHVCFAYDVDLSDPISQTMIFIVPVISNVVSFMTIALFLTKLRQVEWCICMVSSLVHTCNELFFCCSFYCVVAIRRISKTS